VTETLDLLWDRLQQTMQHRHYINKFKLIIQIRLKS